MRALILLAGLGLVAPKGPAGPQPVAIIYRLEGSAKLASAPGQPFLSLTEPWQRLAPGAVIETAAGSTVSVVFWGSARRYVLEPESRAKITARDLHQVKGQVTALPKLPTTIKLDSLLNGGARAAVVIIRGDHESVVLANSVELCLAPWAGMEGYRVEIADKTGHRIWSAEAFSTRVRVPPHILRPGRIYGWRVHAVAGGAGGDWEFFSTLPAGVARDRQALEALARRTDDADLERLLAVVDRELGLHFQGVGLGCAR